jgi:RNA polymerase sigma-70 factor (ECF subfamily)
MTKDPALAEDLAQESFVKAFRSLSAFDTTRRLSSWLFRIAHNTALDAMRRSRSSATADADADRTREDPPAPAVPDPVEQRALGAALQSALAQLRLEHRVATVLRYEEGLSFEEIGVVMGVPAATARSHVHRARKALVRLLTESGWARPR